jgi:hypothetical protein
VKAEIEDPAHPGANVAQKERESRYGATVQGFVLEAIEKFRQRSKPVQFSDQVVEEVDPVEVAWMSVLPGRSEDEFAKVIGHLE